MEPRSLMSSEQQLQMNMLCLNAKYDLTLTDAGESEADVVVNMIEVLSDEAVIDELERWIPQAAEWQAETNMGILAAGTYFGYFRNIKVTSGKIRIVAW